MPSSALGFDPQRRRAQERDLSCVFSNRSLAVCRSCPFVHIPKPEKISPRMSGEANPSHVFHRFPTDDSRVIPVVPCISDAGEAGVASEAAGVAVEASAGAEAVAAESTPPQPPLLEKCVLSQEWVTALVQEMSASADVADAHTRATRVLQAFEAAVRGAVASDGAGAAGADAKAMAENLAKENLILKRAVAIQNARQQEHGQLQQQVAELQRACATYQQELLQAQRTNYSLGLHLKEAMSPSPSTFNRNPDVF